MSRTIGFLALAHEGAALRARTQEMIESFCFGKGVAKPSLWLRNTAELRQALNAGDALVCHKLADLFSTPGDMVSFVSWALAENIAIYAADVGELTERLGVLRVLGEAFAPLEAEVVQLRQTLTAERIRYELIEHDVSYRVTKAVKASLERLDILSLATDAKTAAVAEAPKAGSGWQPVQGTNWQ